MAAKVVESPDRAHELQVRLVQEGMAYGFSVIAAGAVMLIVSALYILFMMWLPHAARASLPGFLAFIALLIMLLIGILVVACYKLIPLYIQYRHVQKQDEEMFP